MPGRLDYSRFDHIGDTDSEEEKPPQAPTATPTEANDLLSELPTDLPRDLALVLAARQGQHNLVEALLQSGVEANAVDPHGISALQRAVESGGIQARATIEALLAARADPCKGNTADDCALAAASASGPAELLSALLGAAVHVPSSSALLGALATAAAKGNRATAQVLLDAGAPAGEASLHSWVDNADSGMVRQLAEKRADVNLAQGDDGETPLTRAARLRHEESAVQLVQLLCDLRADVNQPARFSAPVALGCVLGCHVAGGKALTPLAAASRAGAAKVIQALLECRASVQLPDGSSSMSPLVGAATVGSLPAASALLLARASAEAADAAGRRPLACAVASGSLELLLVVGGAACFLAHGPMRTSEVAQAKLSKDVSVRLSQKDQELLASRADPDQASERGQTPLMLAAGVSRHDLCEQLLTASAQPNSTDPDGKSALLLAAGGGCLPVCEALLRARADLLQRTTAGACALDAAAANGHEAVCRALLDAGADVNLAGPAQRSPADAAELAGHAALAKMLRS
ncbi:ANKRD50 [Symbiodinium natans]|uniref:ANKRD50 protein n=1 Tax=Symbiodinium natans TaxID=878477 RepID=A0A812T7Z6_9DINO|nr:ANKRD50 [Symbiodinium natans]